MEYLLGTISILFAPTYLIVAFFGTLLGIAFGAIPGLSGTAGIILLLPVSFSLPAELAVTLLVSVWTGGISGGFIAATLLGIPGAPSSIATCYDAYPMSQRGETVRALGICTIASFIGTFVSIIIAIFLSPPLAEIAVMLGPWEYFSLCFCALSLVVTLSQEDIFKGLAAAFIGIIFATVGFSPIDGTARFTFNIVHIRGGFSMTAVMMGLFAVRQILIDLGKDNINMPEVSLGKIKGVGITFADVRNSIKVIIRSFFMGFGIGFLPGLGGGIANVIAYADAKSASKHPEEFGTGCPDGIWATEVSNNATIGGALIPMVSLGIPGSTAAAVMLSALVIHGMQPGPMLFIKSPMIVYVMFGGVLLSAFITVVVELFGVRWLPYILKIPYYYLYPTIVLICLTGAFADTKTIFNVGLTLFFATIAIFLTKGGLPVGALVLSYILTPYIETNLRRGLSFSSTGFTPFLTRPISGILLAVGVGNFIWSLCKPALKRRKAAKAAQISG